MRAMKCALRQNVLKMPEVLEKNRRTQNAQAFWLEVLLR